MTKEDLLKQYVDTGIKISEYQISQLNNNLKTTYFRKRLMVGNLDDYEFLALPDGKRTEYINNLNSYGMNNLFSYSKEKEKIIDTLLSTEGFINKLDSDKINTLLHYSKEKDKFKEIIRNYRQSIQLNESKLKLSNLI